MSYQSKKGIFLGGIVAHQDSHFSNSRQQMMPLIECCKNVPREIFGARSRKYFVCI